MEISLHRCSNFFHEWIFNLFFSPFALFPVVFLRSRIFSTSIQPPAEHPPSFFLRDFTLLVPFRWDCPLFVAEVFLRNTEPELPPVRLFFFFCYTSMRMSVKLFKEGFPLYYGYAPPPFDRSFSLLKVDPRKNLFLSLRDFISL